MQLLISTDKSLMLILSCLLFSCSVDDSDISLPQISEDEVYYLVSHGPSTDAGFWRDVLTEARISAEELGVGLIPLHPATETSGALLNFQMNQAVDANPPGIVGTVWGEGMQEVIFKANDLEIPVAAINVYPNPTEYTDGTANLLLYSGQNDYLAARDIAMGLVCATAGLRFANNRCGERTVQDVFNEFYSIYTIEVVCLVHQQADSVFQRCNGFKDVLVDELLLPIEQYSEITWNASNLGEGAQQVEAYYASKPDIERFLIISQGTTATADYLAANLSNEEIAKTKIAAFDTSSILCDALDSGRLEFLSGQGHRLQGKKALEYLYYYVKNGELPVEGMGPDGNPDPRWIVSPDGYPWYKTGPNLLYDDCIEPTE
ncbi:substrate-binding domain-containing protein [Pleionea sediminis]|uniref:substrate-binding domain-containing protein n=1 Tax=Pleionea sediminis TaxID=2569479 RepID=UPI00118566DE|nr:substrate-binding domain-containing protein [Pleionea sediminis]